MTYTLKNQPPTGHEIWKHLGSRLLDRRTSLGLQQSDIASAGGPSPAVIRQFEHGIGGPYRAVTIGVYEKALDWAPGSIINILNNGEPTPNQHTLTRDPLAEVTSQTPLNEVIDRLNHLERAVNAKPELIAVDRETFLAVNRLANEMDTSINSLIANLINEYSTNRQHQ